MEQLVRIVVGAIAAPRYLVSSITASLLLFYELMGLAGYLPRLHELAAQLTISMLLLCVLIYLMVGGIIGVLWNTSTTIQAQMVWRTVYRQTDRSGLLLFDGVLLLLLGGGALLVPTIFVQHLEVQTLLVFLAAIAVFPLLLDFLPTQRPRRVVVPGGQTMREIATNLAPDPTQVDEVLRLLYQYNEMRLTAPDYYEQPDEVLPDGMVLEIPPRF